MKAKHKIITSNSVGSLNIKIQEMIADGWEAVGGHQVVVTHVQNRYAGSQHMDSQYKHEYSQSMKNECIDTSED